MAYTSMSWDDFVQTMSSAQEDLDDEAWLQYIEQLEWLHQHPMDINQATPEEMALLPFLTQSQIESLQAYVHLDGPMKSFGELALVPSIDELTRQILPLFFMIDHNRDKSASKGWFSNMKNSVDSRLDVPLYYRRGYQTGKYLSNPLYNRVRYILESQHLNIGIHAKKDPGESFYDSYGAYAMLRNKGIVKSAIIGDYRVGWGEGLVIGRGTSVSKSNLMNSTSQGIRPMIGFSEYGFLRGAAITIGSKTTTSSDAETRLSLEGTLFASYKTIDATLNSVGEVKTIVESGYHRTQTELSKKYNTHTALLGAHVQGKIGHFVVGATGYWQYFNRPLSPGDDKYRRWYPQGQNFGVFGLHGGYSYYRWTASAEVAYTTQQGGIAGLGRVLWLVCRELKVVALARYYSHRYYSFQASAIAENSKVQNETGAMLRFEAMPFSKVTLTAYADFFADYWPRYGMTSSSIGQEFMFEGKYQIASKHTCSINYRLKRKASNDVLLPHHRFKMQWTSLPNDSWKVQSSAYLHFASTLSPGFGVSQLVRGKMLKDEKLSMGMMASYFYAPDYQTRIYIYEPTLWNSTSSTSNYGHGVRGIITLGYTLFKSRVTLEAKYAFTHMLDRTTISSGLQEILSPTRQDLSFQVRMKL